MSDLYDRVWTDPSYCPDAMDRARDVMPAILRARPASVLDVGCGRGQVVAELRRHGITATGIDPYLPLPPPPDCFRDSLTMAEDRVDAVLSFDVLEHLTEADAIDQLIVMSEVADRCCLGIANMDDPRDVPGLGMVDLHLTKRPATWWAQRVADIWDCNVHIQPWRHPCRFYLWAGAWP